MTETVNLAGSSLLQVPLLLGSHPFVATYDGGSAVSLIELATFQQLAKSCILGEAQGRPLQDIQRCPITTYGTYRLSLHLGGKSHQHAFTVVRHLPSAVLVNRDFCRAHNVVVHHNGDYLKVGKRRVLAVRYNDEYSGCSEVGLVSCNTSVLAWSVQCVSIQAPKEKAGHTFKVHAASGVPDGVCMVFQAVTLNSDGCASVEVTNVSPI